MKFDNWSILNNIDKDDPGSVVGDEYGRLLTAVLRARGISDVLSMRDFLNPGEHMLSDPFSFIDMDRAVARIREAVSKQEKVAVYGDYDVDGITSSCLLGSFFQSLGLSCEIYIPDRLDEGYGLNCTAIESLREMEVSLIITVDCGVTAYKEVEFAKNLGIDVIVTDHHECQGVMPDTIVVNPKRPDCLSERPMLSGVGVAFKLACAVSGEPERIMSLYSDLVAVGTIADVVPLVSENRYIVKRGVEKLRNNPSPGLGALIETAGLTQEKVNTMNVGFALAPRINAAGRLGQVETAIRLFMSGNKTETQRTASELCEFNRVRRETENGIWEESLAELAGKSPEGPIILAKEGWHQGVVGIVASKLSESFSRPSIIICLEGEMGRGSGRSHPNFNLFEALCSCEHLLEEFGGHAQAVGMGIRRENIPAFREAMDEYYRANAQACVRSLEIDFLIPDRTYLTLNCIEQLDLMEPCGCGNPKPQLCVNRAVLQDINAIGGGKHLRLRFGVDGERYTGLVFSRTLNEFGFSNGDTVDIVFVPQINEFKSRRSVQLIITDIRKSDDRQFCSMILGGEKVPLWSARGFTPLRRDFVLFWKSLNFLGGAAAGGVWEILSCFGEAMGENMQIKVSLIITVLSELGLLGFTFSGEMLEVKALSKNEKTDLGSSRLLSKLTGTEGGVYD